MYGDPAHPERPTLAVMASGSEKLAARGAAAARNIAQAASLPVIHAGDPVRLWSAEKNLHLQLSAVALENGAIGDRIRLKIPGAGWESGSGWDGGGSGQPMVWGVVRGAAEVEMEP